MARCQHCGKKTRSGRNVSHSEKKTPRKFKANIQKVTITVGGLKMKMKLCTSCIKKLRKGKTAEKTSKEEKKTKQ